ncbi:hypothetical protein ACFYVL_13580 [Streptomyces sp. NPDC004111]|uniref:hypothetical protein n=1 Tax=Streptomyces sp. NPDC004111 TaxID=3364690 RepID=UPI0036CD68E9
MTAFPPAARARRAVLVGAVCAGLAAGLTGCGEDPDEGTNGVGKLSAAEIEGKARETAKASAAVRLTGTFVSRGGTYKLNMRLKNTGGAGSVTTKDSTFELLRVDDQLFMKAGADFWRHDATKPGATFEKEDAEAADKLEGRYVKVPRDDPAYGQFRGFTDKQVLLDGLLGLNGELGKGDREKIRGMRTIKVVGGAEGEGGALDVSLEKKPYPLRLARAGGAGVVQLTDWDLDFPLSAPPKEMTVDYGGKLPRTNN